VIVVQGTRVMAVIAIGAQGGRIDHLHCIGNPDKLSDVPWIAVTSTSPESPPAR
jgi:thiamine pyrophosphokinase